MTATIPAHVREQQINDLPNISFVRWAGEYKNAHSKAVCRCAVDGYEWPATVYNLLNGRYGCPQCAGRRRWTAEERIEQINALPNIEFVQWANGYCNDASEAICRCTVDGYEWSTKVGSLVRQGTGCPQCGGKRRWTAEERIEQINGLSNTSFVRWDGEYRGSHSRIICRCNVDGFEWSVNINNLLNNGRGCPHCAGKRRWTAAERIAQINALPTIEFVRWVGGYKNANSKAVCRCTIDGFEWPAKITSLINIGSGCPECAQNGYNRSKPGTLYLLRSECGSMAKIGISNDYKKRHTQLRNATPFNWSCIELIHSKDGATIAEFEKELHSWTEQAAFSQPFDGYTEWRKWDARLPRWIERYRARLARIVAP